MSRTPLKTTLAIVVAAAVVGGLAGAAAVATFDSESTVDSAAAAPTSTHAADPTGTTTAAATQQASHALTPEQLYRSASPAVVVITSTQTEVSSNPFFGQSSQQVEGLGSGFVIDDHGDIATNDHVIAGGRNVRVGFSNGASYAASVVGKDAATDVAVVRVDAPTSALHPLRWAGSAGVQVGEAVYAIGNPFGLDRTMTAGIVSATGRAIDAPDGRTIADAIQTDAPINHGNSGGPLLDDHGRVIGIASQIQGGTVDANVGVGFAIPSDTARGIVRQLIATGHVDHAWLGVEVETIDPSVAKLVRGLPEHGVVIARVTKDSPAAKAGLRGSSRLVSVDGVGVPLGGDAIVAVDGKALASSDALSTLVAARRPGDQLRLRVVRDGSTRTVDVTLGRLT
jgi:S1-C subfamily serine protease